MNHPQRQTGGFGSTDAPLAVLESGARHTSRVASPHGFLSTSRFAKVAAIPLRTARHILARCFVGGIWHGHPLTICAVRTRGGASGARYEVAIASLPPNLAARIDAAAAPQAPARVALGADWRLSLVRRIADAGPPGSEERAAELRDVAQSAFYRGGKRAGAPIAERTLRAWVATYERAGAVPLLRHAPRADRGRSRIIAWREWDKALSGAGVPEARQHAIAANLNADVRGLWAGGETSAANIRFSMTVRSRALLDGAGLALPEADMARLCLMPLHYAGEKSRRRARIAHIKRTDAARWASHHVPRVRRHRNGMRPMDLVAVDVRHSDILYRRPDGNLATPKIVAFQDLATNRIFAHPSMLPKGQGIRREHVLSAMRDSATDPAWGLWSGLYLDNGSEFALGLAAEDITTLVDLVRRIHGEEVARACGDIRSRPYNPQSKVIEGTFSTFTRSFEPVYPGFIGGNRMAKKTHNQGRAPVPLPGGEAEILAQFAMMVDFYKAKPQQKGHCKGLSPNQKFAAFVGDPAQPWGAIVLDPVEFGLTFGPDEWRTVQPGGELHIRNRVMAAPGLAAMVGEKVRVRLPILDAARAVVLTDKNEPMMVVREVGAMGMRDLVGARQHGGGRRAASQVAAAAARGATNIDPAAARGAAVAALPPPVAGAPIAVALVHPVLSEAAKAGADVAQMPQRAAEKRRRKDDVAESRRIIVEALRRAG